MSENGRLPSHPWNCQQCSTVLGMMRDDELLIDIKAVKRVQTMKGAIIIQCAKCGRIKSWFNTPEHIIMSAVRAMIRMANEDMLGQMRSLLQERSFQSEVEPRVEDR